VRAIQKSNYLEHLRVERDIQECRKDSFARRFADILHPYLEPKLRSGGNGIDDISGFIHRLEYELNHFWVAHPDRHHLWPRSTFAVGSLVAKGIGAAESLFRRVDESTVGTQ